MLFFECHTWTRSRTKCALQLFKAPPGLLIARAISTLALARRTNLNLWRYHSTPCCLLIVRSRSPIDFTSEHQEFPTVASRDVGQDVNNIRRDRTRIPPNNFDKGPGRFYRWTADRYNGEISVTCVSPCACVRKLARGISYVVFFPPIPRCRVDLDSCLDMLCVIEWFIFASKYRRHVPICISELDFPRRSILRSCMCVCIYTRTNIIFFLLLNANT